MTYLPNTVLRPCPVLATPVMVAQAPGTLATVVIYLEVTLVWKLQLGMGEVIPRLVLGVSGWFSDTEDSSLQVAQRSSHGVSGGELEGGIHFQD